MQKVIKLKKIPNKSTLKDLLELFVYYHLSYPTGQKEICSVQLVDAYSEIITPEIKYKLTDELYTQLYQLSNKVIANLYKVVENDFSIQ